MSLHLADFRVLTFDCYGTLIDWETGILSVLRPWARRHRPDLTDDELLSGYAQSESPCQQAAPGAKYPDILRAVHDAIARRLSIPADAVVAEELAHSVGGWQPFPETPDALRRLKRRYKLVIVSNVDRDSFARTRQRLGVEFDAVVTAEDVGCYKPDRRVFERALAICRGLGADADCVLHVAESLFHDHTPAKTMGLRTVWVARRTGRPGGGATPPADVRPDLTVATLAELADLTEKAALKNS